MTSEVTPSATVKALADLIEGELEYVLRQHAEELAGAIIADGWSK